MGKELIIKDSYKRDVLVEGRNYGFGFALLTPYKSDSKHIFKTLHAFSCCKDYLNDIAFVEKNNIALPEIYGLDYKYKGVFKNKQYAYLGIKILHRKDGADWPQFGECTSTLSSNMENLVKSINKLEEYLVDSKQRTIYYGTDNAVSVHNAFVLKIPAMWVRRGWAISLLSLWIRCFFNVSSETLKLPFTNMLVKQKDKIFIHNDKYMFKTIESISFLKLKFKEFLRKEHPKKEAHQLVVHNSGISNFLKHINYGKRNKKKVKRKGYIASF
jgi:hypothetical protein